MRSAIRSDSYAESVKQEIHESTRTSKPSNRRLKTNDDVQQRSLYYPSGNSLPPSARSSVRGSTLMTSLLDHPDFQKRRQIENTNSKQLSPSPSTVKPPREVSVRVKFIRLGEVITLEEKFYAEVVIEARWLYDPEAASWNPNLYVKNALGDVKQEVARELVDNLDEPVYIDSRNYDIIYVWEIRKVVGTFWEKLELNSFPVDVQQLSLQIVTRCSVDECVLVENRFQPSMVNREAFLAQQEWFLYEQIETRSTITMEDFSFRPIRQSTYLVTCCVARRPGYFYWNVYLLIFLITLIALTVYSVAPEYPQSRLQITCTLLLTSIMFRWSVSRLLPPVSYLTLLDKYTLISLVFISLNSIWHSIIGFLMRHMNISNAVDYYVLGLSTIIFLIYHCIMFVSLYQALRRRQIILESDRKYSTKLAGMFETFAQGHHAVQHFKDRQNSSHVSLFV
ncbi:unnamed protein product [Rotaria magnacalcarata]|uniref:Uncharacterized protein n=2 Tax=Rotaria magnacalcarata TaxID=392030 RepID=A0A816EZM2_9BILA|nr:unnamed protein product [Rotaria magnacalcarata]CAF1652664.1 unnamed protein product [Rotaria magnacalcarata]CAF2126926.1 unnamed protein product [Rotaria magnacalcarata]CAF2239186.1 unnamed protein product [Rotaria magnacalcarata]CAF3947075.1 unnamed protein product [Rotaria magnacalcarata]